MRLSDNIVEIGTDLGIRIVIAVYHLLCFGHGNVQRLAETKRLLPIDDAEVDRLGTRAHIGRYLVNRHAKDIGSRMGMEVLATQECVDEPLITRKMREQPQLNLRVIGRQEHTVRRRDEGLADAATELRAHGNVLQVGIGRGEPACRRDRLIEARVDASVGTIDERRQSVQIRRTQLGKFAILNDLIGQRVIITQLFEHGGVR